MREIHVCFLNPRHGEAPLTWAQLPKSEATIGESGCGPQSRGCDVLAEDRPPQCHGSGPGDSRQPADRSDSAPAGELGSDSERMLSAIWPIGEASALSSAIRACCMVWAPSSHIAWVATSPRRIHSSARNANCARA